MKQAFPVVVHKGAILLALWFTAFFANAGDLTVWHPTTAAGGAPVPPGYWDQQASYQFFGSGSMQTNNVTLAPTYAEDITTVVDYSMSTMNTSNSGSQTNYIPITRDNSTMNATNTTTTSN